MRQARNAASWGGQGAGWPRSPAGTSSRLSPGSLVSDPALCARRSYPCCQPWKVAVAPLELPRGSGWGGVRVGNPFPSALEARLPLRPPERSGGHAPCPWSGAGFAALFSGWFLFLLFRNLAKLWGLFSSLFWLLTGFFLIRKLHPLLLGYFLPFFFGNFPPFIFSLFKIPKRNWVMS